MSDVNISSSEYAANWQKGISNNIGKTTANIQKITEHPGQKAAAQKDVWLQNIVQSADTWAKNVQAQSLDDWKKITIQKINERASSGAQAAIPKMQKFAAWHINRLNTILPAIKAMPKKSLQDNINRMVAFVTAAASESYKAQK